MFDAAALLKSLDLVCWTMGLLARNDGVELMARKRKHYRSCLIWNLIHLGIKTD